VIPRSWRYKLAHIYLAEIFAAILGVGAGVFGATVVALPDNYRQVPSFKEAFALAPPQVWGLSMVVLAVAMLTLLIHSRAAAAIPTFLLGIVWVLWVVPVAMSPGYAPSAPIIYTIISALTLVTGAACLVRREDTDERA
jgi:hypothetical protein